MKSGSDDLRINITPKPLLKINGIPIIRRTVEELNSDNIAVAIVVNQADKELFDMELAGLKFEYYYQNSPWILP